MGQRLWLLGKGKLGKVLLGGGIRTIEMATFFSRRGWEVILAMDACERDLPEGVRFEQLDSKLFAQFRPGDAVVTTTFLPPIFLMRLLFSRIPFQLDFFTTGAMENLETIRHSGWLKGLMVRRRTAAKYRLLLARAELVYFSTRQQLAFVAGMLYDRHEPRWAHIASRLPACSRVVPMGVSDEAWTTGRANPYLPELQNRPIYLWGGGIWSWYDLETLLGAFKLLQDEGHPACLYFLAGKNTSGLTALDAPVQNARDLSDRLGLTGKSVFFHMEPIAYQDVPAYLEHSIAGVMSNPATVESLGSWRTRLLQTLWAGKPLVASGYDPLTSQMAEAGASLMVEAGDIHGLRDALKRVADDPALRQEMSRGSFAVGAKHRWSRILGDLEKDLLAPDAFQKVGHRPSIVDAFRFLAGI
jgi:glycosyltransferase involved in cell wall biosynthesis